METNSKADTSRINGAKSQGPITPEGKANSSRNALKHGLAADNIMLTVGEPIDQLEAFLNGADDLFQPKNAVEGSLVELLCSSLWRLRRVMDFETAILDARTATIDPEIDAEFERVDARTRKALAFKALADESLSLHLILRYEGRATRTFMQALKALRDIQQERYRSEAAAEAAQAPPAPVTTSEIPNEPKPPVTQTKPATSTHLHPPIPSKPPTSAPQPTPFQPESEPSITQEGPQ